MCKVETHEGVKGDIPLEPDALSLLPLHTLTPSLFLSCAPRFRRPRGAERLFRIFSFDAGVKILNDFHIRFHISGRVNDRPDTPNLASVIQIPQHDGDIRPFSNMVKAGFPVHDFPAGSGRRNHQDHSCMCTKGLYRLCHNMG